MMPEALPDPTVRRRSSRRRALFAAALLAASATAGAAEKPMISGPSDESAGLMVAEVALERGDCRAASDAYVKLALASSDPKLASRATQVSLACAQLEPASRASTRWRALEPLSGDASLASAIIALKLYRLEDARSALGAWRDSPSAGTQDPSQFAELLARESDATAASRVFGQVLVGSDPTAEVLLAQARLAQQSFDLAGAIKFAERALAIEPALLDAKTLIARCRAMQGDVDGALVAARELEGQLNGEDRFLVPDILNAADRNDEARKELEKLRETAELASSANRRLGAIALSEGDLAGAETQFTALMGDRNTTAAAVFYLAQIFERKGDVDRALQSYELLADSALGLTARGSAARLLMKKGQRQKALQLLDDYGKAHPDEAVEVATARSQLLAGAGLYDVALADLDSALQRFPAHHDLEYQRATLLERAGRKKESVAAFKALAKKRPDDPNITNALGFTLADHDSELSLADKLVRQALSVSPDSPAIQDSQGWVLYRKGRKQDASVVLERAFRNLRDPEIGAHFGEVLWTLGDQARAHYVWQQALNVDPDNTVLRNTISRLTGEEAPRAQR